MWTIEAMVEGDCFGAAGFGAFQCNLIGRLTYVSQATPLAMSSTASAADLLQSKWSLAVFLAFK